MLTRFLPSRYRTLNRLALDPHSDAFFLSNCPSCTDTSDLQDRLCAYRLLDPGSEWRLHRHWYRRSTMGDLLGEQDTVAAKDTLYRCLDLLVGHKEALFSHLSQRWQDLFGLKFEVLLYDLTSTYFEADPDPERGEEDKRRYGYSRDKLALTAKKMLVPYPTPLCALIYSPTPLAAEKIR